MIKKFCIWLLLFTASGYFSCSKKNGTIYIAVPDDLCGLIAVHMAAGKQTSGAQFIQESFPLMDCCSTTAEWALSSDRIDAAWLCPDAARNLLAKDKRFEIIGPALVNSQILVVRQGVKPGRIAYSHRRVYLRELIYKRYGSGCEAIPVMPAALPYIYEKGEVDGIVIDAMKAIPLKGGYIRLSENRNDVVTYVLIVNRDFRISEKYSAFIDVLLTTAKALNNADILTETLGKEKNIMPVSVKQILSLGVRFIPPPVYRNQGK